MPFVVTEIGFIGELLTRFGLPANADVGPAERGTNNHTFLVVAGGRRFALRLSQNLTTAQVRAEHRLLARLGRAGLPFAVPAPVAAPDGTTVIETQAGPASLCRWLPGVRPDLDREEALERFGRAVGLLSEALQRVPLADAPQDWRGAPLPLPVDGADGEALWRELQTAGLTGEQIALLDAAARRYAHWWRGPARALPAQVVHGDLAASNALVDPDTGEVTALLDFEIAGADFRVQDLLVALYQSGALDGERWQRRATPLLRGHASVRTLTGAEVEALPELVLGRSLGTVLWRAARWRRAQDSIADVIDRVERLAATTRWLAAYDRELVALASAIGCGRPIEGRGEVTVRSSG
jgi:homoserine kinase type II